jgi:hypothetical protein
MAIDQRGERLDLIRLRSKFDDDDVNHGILLRMGRERAMVRHLDPVNKTDNSRAAARVGALLVSQACADHIGADEELLIWS